MSSLLVSFIENLIVRLNSLDYSLMMMDLNYIIDSDSDFKDNLECILEVSELIINIVLMILIVMDYYFFIIFSIIVITAVVIIIKSIK
jgi:hypothetical protein